jgi:hypothetical protein
MVLEFPQDGNWGRLLFVVSLFFGVCFGVAYAFFFTCLHSVMQKNAACECGDILNKSKNSHITQTTKPKKRGATKNFDYS